MEQRSTLRFHVPVVELLEERRKNAVDLRFTDLVILICFMASSLLDSLMLFQTDPNANKFLCQFL